jgi:hypothetical protein
MEFGSLDDLRRWHDVESDLLAACDGREDNFQEQALLKPKGRSEHCLAYIRRGTSGST